MAKIRKHILLVAYPGFGHINPLTELGKKLAQHHTITFATSACMLDQIRQREVVRENDFTLIGIEDGHKNFEGTLSQPKLLELMRLIVEGARKLFSEIPAHDRPTPTATFPTPVDAVICDNMLAGALPVCHNRGIPYHIFETASFSVTLAALTVHDDTPVVPYDANGAMFIEMPESGNRSGPVSQFQKTMMFPINQAMPMAASVVVNSVRELDREFLLRLEDFPHMKKISIRFVGPLVPQQEKVNQRNMEVEQKVKIWMDNLPTESVVYVSYGSVATPPAAQIPDLMKALLQLKKPFIFTCPDSHHKYLPQEIAAKIPTQFESGQFLMLPWSPQKLILQHPATAVFLSHCGWNSTLEAVFSGVPVVAWPMFAEQKINALSLTNLGMAVMMEGTGCHSTELVIPAEEIFQAIKRVGGFNDHSEKSDCRDRVKKWQQIVTNSSSELEFQQLLMAF